MASKWQHQRAARSGILDDSALHTEHFAHQLLGEHITGISRAAHGTTGHRDEAIGVARGQIEIVKHHDDRGAAGFVQVRQEIEHFHLMADV